MYRVCSKSNILSVDILFISMAAKVRKPEIETCMLNTRKSCVDTSKVEWSDCRLTSLPQAAEDRSQTVTPAPSSRRETQVEISDC